MLQEWNQRSCDRSNLLRRDVHQFHLVRLYDRIICIATSLNLTTDKRSIIIQRSITLSYNLILLFFGRQINDMVIVKIHFTTSNFAVRSFDKAKIIDLCIHTQRRNQTNVRSFRRFNRTQTSIVCIVHVTHLKSGTVTRQTARTQGRQTTFVSDFSQWIRLIHELRQSIRTEEGIDYRRNRFRVNQIRRGEHFIITYIHALTNGTRHTSQADGKLIGELLTNRTHTTIAQVVNIINYSFRIN